VSTRRTGTFKRVTSLSNPLVKDLRGLHQKKFRDASGTFLAEGLKLVAEAREAGWQPKTFAYAGKIADHALVQKLAAATKAGGGLVLEVSEEVLSKIARRDNPQMAVGVFEQAWTPLSNVGADPASLWVGLDRIRDPGNLGTILRTVDAVGAAGVVLVGQCCDPWSIEAVRATMGSVFHTKLARADEEAFLGWRASWPGRLIGTHLKGAVDFRTIDYSGPVMILMGNEQAGLPDRLAEACDALARIPQVGRADSLNLAMATVLMLYEARRDALAL